MAAVKNLRSECEHTIFGHRNRTAALYKGGAEYDLAWILSYRAGTETRPYDVGEPRGTGDFVDMLPCGNSIFLPDGKIDIPPPAVILSAVELLRRDSDSLCSSLLRSSIPLRSTQNDIGAKARDEVAAGSRAAVRYTPAA